MSREPTAAAVAIGTRPPKKYRWGMLDPSVAAPIETTNSLLPESKNLGDTEKHLQWEDFVHSKTLNLSDSGSTSIAYTRATDKSIVLRFCSEKDYTPQKQQLVELAFLDLESNAFLSTACVFAHNDLYYVGSEMSDISLEDIVESSIPLEEEHIWTILCQVS
jgi:hypothetical protein